MSKKIKNISISKDYSISPGGRHKTDGPYSGEDFRESVLVPLTHQYDLIRIDLSGTSGYGSSFLEEAFGGLVRVLRRDIKGIVEIYVSDDTDNSYLIETNAYINEALKDIK